MCLCSLPRGLQVAWCTARGQLLCAEAVPLFTERRKRTEVPAGGPASSAAAAAAAADARERSGAGDGAAARPTRLEVGLDGERPSHGSAAESAEASQGQGWGPADLSRAFERILHRSAELCARVRGALADGAEESQAPQSKARHPQMLLVLIPSHQCIAVLSMFSLV